MKLSVEELFAKIEERTEHISSSSQQFYLCPVFDKFSMNQTNWEKDCIIGRIPIDPELMGIANPEDYFFLHITEEGMNQLIRQDAYAFIHKQSSIKNGEIAAVLVNDNDILLRKFSKLEDFIILEPMSYNSFFTTQVYSKDDHIQIVGKYMGKFEIHS